MNTLVRFKSPSFADFQAHPLRPFADSNLSLFDEFFEGIFDTPLGGFLPYNTIAIDENTYSIEVALAGFKKEDFIVHIEGDELKIESKTQESNSTNSSPENSKFPFYIHKGIAKRSFSLKFRLPKDATVDDPIFRDGLLTIAINKPVPKVNKTKMLTVK